MANVNIQKLYTNLKEVKAYNPPYSIEHHRLRQILLSIYRSDFDFSAVTIEELERLIDIYNNEYDYDINAIEADLEQTNEIITALQSIPPRRVRNAFI
ncbi:hypothetical protein IT084_10450 [Desulfallas sp. Bu1-1]|uniref:hypothetical protein n=1 Tax=Desulfallas sp. Bu1-1 TaxID=2787620 RepID=UPI00189E8708|nr:hypothetical protein [Desulfallas sp. Bu1-1]MBF7083393.1 hypothetical protein [Desulfallas sp. Bu1-1]